ncbi:peptidase inhibitor family I36 protein [Pseudolysinimonas sp.]|jgi:hypothetical protein|uniref:peptidase inhibitor family I36 protein n=1 Tax=Pseudolysinimonas sp. TaxID=2680009 RepID=UPI0037849928
MNKQDFGRKSKVRKFVASAAAAVGLTLTALLGLATPANADGLSSCPTSYTCVWEDLNYETNGNYLGRVSVYYYIPNLWQWDYDGTSVNANDSVTSVYNKANTESAAYYKNSLAGGSYFIFVAGQKDGDLSNGSPSGSFNDQLSSIYYCSQTSVGC